MVAVHVLSLAGGDAERVVPVLTERLRDSDDWVNYFAIRGLIAYGSAAEKALPFLRSLTNTSDPLVRQAALSAVKDIAKK
jgi:HEAT repeat protein